MVDCIQLFTEVGPHTPSTRSDELTDYIDVSFFVPCLNEEKHVIGTVEKLIKVCSELDMSFEILVFDDGSKDNTSAKIQAFQTKHPDARIRLFINKINLGLARNFVEGAFQGQGKYYRLVCGDDVESEEALHKILEKAGGADIIIPYHTRVEGRSFFRSLVSRAYTNLVNLASGQKIHYYNGLPLYRRRDVMRFHVEATGLGYQAEFLLRLLQENRSFIQIPLTVSDREGSSALNLRNFISVGYSLFKILLLRIRGTMRE